MQQTVWDKKIQVIVICYLTTIAELNIFHDEMVLSAQPIGNRKILHSIQLNFPLPGRCKKCPERL